MFRPAKPPPITHQPLGGLAELLVVERVADGRLDQADVGAAVEARALESEGIHRLFLQQCGDRIGQLDLAPGARPGALQQLEDARVEHVTADHRQRTGRGCRLRLFYNRADPPLPLREIRGSDDAVAGGLLARHVLHRDHACATRLGGVGHLL